MGILKQSEVLGVML